MNPRNKVYWIGPKPKQALELEFENRDLDIDTQTFVDVPLDSIKAKKTISAGRGAIMMHNPAKLNSTVSFLKLITDSIPKYSGVTASIIVNDTSEIGRILSTFFHTPDYPVFQEDHVSFQSLEEVGYGSFARYFSVRSPGRAPNFDLSIDSDSTLSEEQETLLRRSFADCHSIVIRKLSTQGFSAQVYLAYPQFESGESISRSLPFLVKFDNKKEIEGELNYYKVYVDQYLPFNLRPNIEPTRCFSFAGEMGILVASYVDRVVSLLDAIDLGTGPAAIHCLFEESLDRWFRNSKYRPEPPVKALIKRFQKDKFDKNPEVLKEAESLGSLPKPDELIRRIEMIKCDSYKRGISHGDLHARNVLVKGSDAIVIDFSRCDTGPILIDLATLDVSIAFYSIFQRGKIRPERFVNWVEFVKQIYSLNRIQNMPEAREGYETFSRQWSCIRQLRRFSIMEQSNDLEYVVCVMIELLRNSMYVNEDKFGVNVTAYAYYLCCELLREIETKLMVRTN